MYFRSKTLKGALMTYIPRARVWDVLNLWGSCNFPRVSSHQVTFSYVVSLICCTLGEREVIELLSVTQLSPVCVG